MSIKRVGVAVKQGSTQAYSIARELLEYGEYELGLEMYIEREFSGYVSWHRVFDISRDPIDVVIVIGGDGTLFRVLHTLGDRCVPIMTVRMGKRGFLLDVDPSEARSRLRDLVEGRYKLVEYPRLCAVIHPKAKRLPYALNDVVIKSWGPSETKVIRLSVTVDDEYVYGVDGDGIVVATPLGSTGYSLAAGGPILDTSLRGFVITPIAPMQLGIRPIVVDMARTIRIRLLESSGPAACVVDGQSVEVVRPGEMVEISRAHVPATIIRFRDISPFERLRRYMP